MLTWLKDNGPVIGALAGALLALVAVLQFLVAGPINRGFDDLRSEMSSRFEAVDRRFDDLRSEMIQRLDAVDERLGRLETGVSELRTLSDRVSRSEGQIDLLREQLRTVDAPAP